MGNLAASWLSSPGGSLSAPKVPSPRSWAPPKPANPTPAVGGAPASSPAPTTFPTTPAPTGGNINWNTVMGITGQKIPTTTYKPYYSEYFDGLNMDKLRAEAPWLADKIGNYQAGKGQLGQTYQYLVGRLGKAITADDVFSENDIRGAGLAERNAGAAGWYNEEQGLQDQAAVGGMVDSGDTYKYLATRGAEADLATEQAAEGRVSDLTSYNQEFKYNSLQSAISALNEWATNRRNQRQSDAGASAMGAQASGMADAQRIAGAWGAGSALLGAGASMAGGYIKH